MLDQMQWRQRKHREKADVDDSSNEGDLLELRQTPGIDTRLIHDGARGWGRQYMNFHHMPELDWHLGYPIALALMFVSAAVPFLYFKRKGWL